MGVFKTTDTSIHDCGERTNNFMAVEDASGLTDVVSSVPTSRYLYDLTSFVAKRADL